MNNVETEHHLLVFIDKQQFRLEDRDYTPRELLAVAGEEPAETTLAIRHGHEVERFDDAELPFRPKNGSKFVVFHNAPTPVS